MPKPTIIPKIEGARLDRLLAQTARALRFGLGGIAVGYRMRSDHSSLIDSSGRLLIDAGSHVETCQPFFMGNLTRCLQYADPATLHELARGYKIARDAGLLTDQAEIDNNA